MLATDSSREAKTARSTKPSYEQLHGTQCIGCPGTTGLSPDGHVTVDGLTWAVKSCPAHAGEARA